MSRLRRRTGHARPVAPGASWAWRVVLVYAVSRVVTLAAAAIAADLNPESDLARALGSWDVGWYQSVAENGYPRSIPIADGEAAQSTLGFFPLFPLALRLGHGLGLSYLVAGILVSTAAGLGMMLVLWKLLAHLSGDAAADRGVALTCFFPGSLVLSMGYAESLGMLFTVGCLYALVRRGWVLAGLLGALATATRPNAVAVVAACGWAAGVAVWRHREWRAVLAPVLASSGTLAFFTFLDHHTGSFKAYLRTQREGWDQVFDPWSVLTTARAFVKEPFGDTNATVLLLGVAFTGFAVWAFVRSRPPGTIVVYTAVTVALALFVATAPHHFTTTKPRSLLAAFPLITALSAWVPRTQFPSWLAGSATLLGAFTVLSLSSLLVTL